MPTEGTTICCCGSRTWVQIIAWWEIVWSVIGGIICFVVALTAYPVHSTKDNPNAEVLYVVIIMAALLIFAMNFAVAIVLLVGNQQERLNSLWTWLIKTAVLNLIIYAILFAEACGYGYYTFGSFQGVLRDIFFFSILFYTCGSTYVVHVRKWDVMYGYRTLDESA